MNININDIRLLDCSVTFLSWIYNKASEDFFRKVWSDEKWVYDDVHYFHSKWIKSNENSLTFWNYLDKNDKKILYNFYLKDKDTESAFSNFLL